MIILIFKSQQERTKLKMLSKQAVNMQVNCQRLCRCVPLFIYFKRGERYIQSGGGGGGTRRKLLSLFQNYFRIPILDPNKKQFIDKLVTIT